MGDLDDDATTNWAGALVMLLPRGEPEVCVAEIVTALKYPTAAGAATDALLDAFHGIDPNAPGKEAGLAASLSWTRGSTSKRRRHALIRCLLRPTSSAPR